MGINSINLATGPGADIWEYTVSTWLRGRIYGNKQYQPGYRARGGYMGVYTVSTWLRGRVYILYIMYMGVHGINLSTGACIYL